MFWNKFDSMLAKESSVQDLLLSSEPENVTLSSLFEKEDCIQETKARNPQLIKVLTRKDILMELVNLIKSEPSGEVDPKNRFKDATVACEMLNADVPEITEALTQSPDYLDALFNIFDTSETLSPILTSFVSRTLGLLIARRPYEVLDYLNGKENLLDMILKHLNVTAVTDFFIRLITAHEQDAFRYKICEWLNGQSFLEKTAAFLDATKTPDPDFHSNSAQLICDIIRFSREQQLQQLKPEDDINQLTPDTYANELLKTADREAFIGLIVSNLIRSSCSQSAIVQSLTVLGAPFEFIPVNFDGNNEQKALFSELSLQVVNSRIERYSQVLSPVIPQLCDILTDPPMRNSLISELANGDPAMSKRIGQVRLHLIRLVALLISFGRSQLNRAIYDSGIILRALDMFFEFQWNSFFHAQVQNCISLILRNTPMVFSDPPNVAIDHPLLHQLIITGNLQKRIMEAWKGNMEAEIAGKPRRPYMGHLLVISMDVSSDQTPNHALVQLLMKELDNGLVQEWMDFATNCIKPQAEIQSRCLAGIHPLQQILSVIHGPPSATRIPGNAGAFEYDSASVPALSEAGLGDMALRDEDRPSGSNKSIFDQTTDEEMRLRRLDGDDDLEDDFDDDDMTGAASQAQIRRLAELASPKAKLPTPDWPATQPLHVSEKAGIERLEEAENANSPWESAMGGSDGGALASEFPWKPETPSSVGTGNDAWADFSNFPTDRDVNNSGGSDFFVSSAGHSLPNLNSDSEGEPFEFAASPTTPEPVDIAVEMAVVIETPSGDVNMADPSVSGDSVTAFSSTLVLLEQSGPAKETSQDDLMHTN